MLKPGDKVEVTNGMFKELHTVVANEQDAKPTYTTVDVPLNRGWGSARGDTRELWNVYNGNLKFLGATLRRGGE